MQYCRGVAVSCFVLFALSTWGLGDLCPMLLSLFSVLCSVSLLFLFTSLHSTPLHFLLSFLTFQLPSRPSATGALHAFNSNALTDRKVGTKRAKDFVMKAVTAASEGGQGRYKARQQKQGKSVLFWLRGGSGEGRGLASLNPSLALVLAWLACSACRTDRQR